MNDIDHSDLEFDTGEFETSGSDYPQYEARVFDEAQELEFASELLTLGSEGELDQFLGGLLREAGQALKSPVARKLGGLLKGAAKKVLPLAAGAAGTLFGGPLGGMAASGAAKAAGEALGLELEGLSPEDQEFETARQFVRFAADAARKATREDPSEPGDAARRALTQAARRHAPGLLRPVLRAADRVLDRTPDRELAAPTPPRRAGAAQSGRWHREGQRIVLTGL